MSSISYEIKTIEKMVRLYCKLKHGRKDMLCSDCNTLLEYSKNRLLKCPFGDEKGACSACKVHCYSKDMRHEMKKVMRFSGPRMIFYHPLDYLQYIFVDKKRKK